MKFLLALLLFAEGRVPFEELLGRGTAVWEYVKTPEDKEKIELFAEAFEQGLSPLSLNDQTRETIPRTIHFIWLGPYSVPGKIALRMGKWKRLHPNWDLVFWTDRERLPPVEGAMVRLISAADLPLLQEEYYLADGLKEKEMLLALEILYKEGGIFSDLGIDPARSFSSLSHLDFFCSLAALGPSTLSSSVIPSGGLIGAKGHHPILREAIEWLKTNRGLIYSSQLTPEQRVLGALSHGIEEKMGEEGNLDVPLPPSFFLEEGEAEEREAAISPTRSATRKEEEEALLILLLAAASTLVLVLTFLYIRKATKEETP